MQKTNEITCKNTEKEIRKTMICGIGACGVEITSKLCEKTDSDLVSNSTTLGFLQIDNDFDELAVQQLRYELNITPIQIRLSSKYKGLGNMCDQNSAAESYTKNKEEILVALSDSDMVILVSGTGGGCSGMLPELMTDLRDAGKEIVLYAVCPGKWEKNVKRHENSSRVLHEVESLKIPVRKYELTEYFDGFVDFINHEREKMILANLYDYFDGLIGDEILKHAII